MTKNILGKHLERVQEHKRILENLGCDCYAVKVLIPLILSGISEIRTELVD
jgi:hypothetical protein